MLRSAEQWFFLTGPPPVGIIPLGTGGNDLSRSLNWGGLYEEDKPLQKVILDITKAQIVYIDRWSLNMTLNSELSQKYNHAHDKLVSFKKIAGRL